MTPAPSLGEFNPRGRPREATACQPLLLGGGRGGAWGFPSTGDFAPPFVAPAQRLAMRWCPSRRSAGCVHHGSAFEMLDLTSAVLRCGHVLAQHGLPSNSFCPQKRKSGVSSPLIRSANAAGGIRALTAGRIA
jgi:hypothetical protein